MEKNHSQLADMGIRHFSNQYRDLETANISKILQIFRLIHRFVEEDDLDDLNASVTLGEVEGVMKWFKKEKSLGPDGWPCCAIFSFSHGCIEGCTSHTLMFYIKGEIFQ